MKTKKKINKALATSVATSLSLLTASAAIVFGISAGMFKVNYMSLNDAEARVQAARLNNYYSQAIKSEWDMLAKPSECEQYLAAAPTKRVIQDNEWWRLHGNKTPLLNQWSSSCPDTTPESLGYLIPKGIDYPADGYDHEAIRRNYVSMVLDGSSHAALDHSFNQSLFQGFLNFIKNKDNSAIQGDNDIKVYKPGQDTTPFFQEIYRTAASSSRIVGLPGFIHVAPMESLGYYDTKTGLHNFNRTSETDTLLDQTAFILIDGDIPNNQNVASVLFRSDQPAFLAGLSTCMYFMHNLPVYHEYYKDLSVATFGGAQIPTVVIYMGGYERGIEFFNEFVLKGILRKLRLALNGEIEWDNTQIYNSIYENSKYKTELKEWKDGKLDDPDDKIKNKLINPNNYSGFLYDEYEVKIIKLGDFSTHFTGTFTAGDAIGITKQLVNRGASAIMPVAGAQTTDASQEVQNQNSSCIVVGVDAVMEDGDDQRVFKNQTFKDQTIAPDGSTSLQANNHLKFSACKDMSSVIDSITRLSMQNLNWDVNGEAWEHSYNPDYSEEGSITLNEENCDFTTQGTNVIVKGLKEGIDLTNKHSIIVPNEVTIEKQQKEIVGIGANAFSYKNQGIDNIESIKFECQNNFTIATNAFYTSQSMRSKLQLLDFASVPENVTITIQDLAFNTNPATAEIGVVSLNPELSYEAKKSFVNNSLSKGFGNFWGSWLSDEHPNPNKSVCNIGYKTCGNIQNGMISVSFDGWYYLIEALHTIDLDPTTGFEVAWKNAAAKYLQDNPTAAQDQEFVENVYEYPFTPKNAEWYSQGNTGLMSFKRYKDIYNIKPTSIYQNYNRIICILGMVLNDWKLTFPSYMTIKEGTANDPQIATEDQVMSIADWLDLNMYFTC